MIRLQSDLYTAFDDHTFIFFPKKGNNSYKIYMLWPAPDLIDTYHNKNLYSAPQCNARFVSSIKEFRKQLQKACHTYIQSAPVIDIDTSLRTKGSVTSPIGNYYPQMPREWSHMILKKLAK